MLPIIKKIRKILGDKNKNTQQKRASISKELDKCYTIKPELEEYIGGDVDKEIDNNICLTQIK